MSRRGAAILVAVLLVALVGLTSGCGVFVAERAPARHHTPKRAKHLVRHSSAPKVRVFVSVFDGDTGKPLRGALVRATGRKHHANRRGFVALRVRRSRPVRVIASARGYAKQVERKGFHRERHWRTVFLYRPKLQWPLYGATARRTQAQLHIRLKPPFRVVWSGRVGGLIEFPAVVYDGVAYIGNSHGTVYALSMRSGKLVWRRNLDSLMASSPAVAGKLLVVHDMSGHVWVLNRSTGHVRHSYTVGSAIESSPVVRGDVDYFGAWNGVVYALDLRRHGYRWTYQSGYKITSSAALSGNTLYIGDYGGRLLALETATGRARWAGSVNGRIYGTPAVAGGRVFAPSSDGSSLTAFSTAGNRLWSVGTGSYVYSSPAARGARVYFGSYNGLLYCVSARSGHVLWTRSVGGRVSGAVVVVGGIVYAATKGHTIGVEAGSGRQVFSFPHGDYVPVSGNAGRLLFHGYSRLWAVEPRRRR
jgi:outer membrane protein assembly factor BamB